MRQGDEPGGFSRREFRWGLAEVVPGAAADAFEVAAHRREAGVAVEDGGFVVVGFELEGAQGLADFAGEGMRGAVDEARRLHGEGGRARADAAAAQVFAKRAQDGNGINAVVLVVTAVFVVEQQRGVVGGQGAGWQATFAVGREVAVQQLAVAVVHRGRVVVADADVRRVGEVEAAQGESGESGEEAEGKDCVVYDALHFLFGACDEVFVVCVAGGGLVGVARLATGAAAARTDATARGGRSGVRAAGVRTRVPACQRRD